MAADALSANRNQSGCDRSGILVAPGQQGMENLGVFGETVVDDRRLR